MHATTDTTYRAIREYVKNVVMRVRPREAAYKSKQLKQIVEP